MKSFLTGKFNDREGTKGNLNTKNVYVLENVIPSGDSGYL